METNDDFIADFAVAVGADYVKFGALNRGEHIAKYNRLSQIDAQLKLL
jgi:enolase